MVLQQRTHYRICREREAHAVLGGREKVRTAQGPDGGGGVGDAGVWR